MSAARPLRQRPDACGALGGMSIQRPGTSGGRSGTSGWPDWAAPTLVVALAALVVTFVNATSKLIEAGRMGVELDARAPWVWELSSVLIVVPLAPLIGRAIARWPFSAARWPSFLAIHLAAATAYSIAHVLGMVLLRKIAYALDGALYDFSQGELPLMFFYEWRKDVLSYAAIAACFWQFAERRARRAAPPAAMRLEIKDGARTVLLDPGEILWVEAAGNYVELNTASGAHLARGALASFEAKLAPRGFVRIHRSRLVNRARIRAMKPTPAGDLELTLDDGRAIAASRRYRANLETGPTL